MPRHVSSPPISHTHALPGPYLEDLLHVDRVRGRAEDLGRRVSSARSTRRSGAPPRRTSGACIALENRLACLVISSCSSTGNWANASYLVPIRTGMAVCAWRWRRGVSLHSLAVCARGRRPRAPC